MLRESRRLNVPELDAFHEQIDVRTRSLRVGVQRARKMLSDFALVERAVPFRHHLSRPQLLIVLDGQDRFDEAGRRTWLEPGDAMLSDAGQGGTDALGGRSSWCLYLDWEPVRAGVAFQGPPRTFAIGRRDLARLADAARDLTDEDRAGDATVRILAMVRALGLPLATTRDPEIDADDARFHATFSEQLWNLDAQPAICELAESLATNERRVHRRIARISAHYRLPWTHWRGALRYARMLQALRLLSAGATTERVARATGLRSPAALCHAFEASGLPSPGALARAARRDGLAAWAA